MTPTQPQTRYPITLLTLAVLLPTAILLSLTVGAIHLPIHALLTNHLDETQKVILNDLRLPRVLASAIVGAALAVAGLLFQGLFRNPMADPYIIGASGGAGLGATLGILFFSGFSLLGFSATALCAFAGALLTMTVVYAVARTHGRTSGTTLLLAGFSLGLMLSNITQIFIVFDPNSTLERLVESWLRGAIGIPTRPQLSVAAALLALALAATLPLMRRLNTLSLGDEYADQLGLPVEATRIAILVTGSLLTALAVSLGGLISFAGLLIPHIARLLLGPDHVRLLPVTALAGALFLVLTDTLARTLFAPTELPVGILMVFLGGPFFLYLLRKQRRGDYTL